MLNVDVEKYNKNSRLYFQAYELIYAYEKEGNYKEADLIRRDFDTVLLEQSLDKDCLARLRDLAYKKVHLNL